MIVPSIDLMDGRAVQLVGGREKVLDAGDPRPLAEHFGLVGEIAVVDLDAALGRGDNRAVIEDLLRRAPCRVGGGIRSAGAARAWLDAGAVRVVLGTAAEPDVLAQLPRERVVAALDARDGDVVVDGWRRGTGRGIAERMGELRELCGGFLVTFVEREGRLQGTDLQRAAELVAVAGNARVTIAGGVTTADEIAALDRLGADAQVGMALYTGKLALADAFAAPLSSDRPDGLWPTVVVDEHGTALGLCYSDRDSLRAALDERAGVYRSRKRGTWRKGATSGATQELLAVAADCDRDALRFVVRQREPGFCHAGTWSCFGPAHGLPALWRRLAAAAELPADSPSYTRRLLGDPALLTAKLREETDELIAAADPAAATHEAADVLYFTLVRALASGTSLADVERVLDARALRTTRRPGPAKGQVVSGTTWPPSAVLPRKTAADVARGRREPVDASTRDAAARLLASIEAGGLEAILRAAHEFGDLRPGEPWLLERPELEAAREALAPDARAVLERTAERIGAFARAQRACLRELDVPVPGGRAGHHVVPVARAGCYAPGGRYPLPSSVLMTAVTARAAGVGEVWVASPRPTAITRAAAAIAGADGLLALGGVQAIAALAFGAGPVPPADIVVGPGNRFVTAAKQLLFGRVGIEALAGPSELVVLADAGADADLVAADLLAQAEHDPDAWPVLVTTSAEFAGRVDAALAHQLETLPTAGIARAALQRGAAVVVGDLEEGLATCDALAPEHLALHCAGAAALAARVQHAGAVFVGARSAEVFGDYGAGPNHVLPTGGSARATGGLSVFTFLRARTWLALDEPGALAADAAALARLEGLEAHARAAELRVERRGRGP